MSMRLATTQQQFLHMLIDRPNNLATEIREGGKIDVAARLGIYRHAYRARLTEVMQDIFEHTWTYIGDDSFEQCAHSYVDRTTPSGRTLQGFGATFPDWLVDRFPEDADIADVARIDWMLRVAFDGANAKPIVIGDLAALTPDDWSVDCSISSYPRACIVNPQRSEHLGSARSRRCAARGNSAQRHNVAIGLAARSMSPHGLVSTAMPIARD